jgi:hypothetical protein
MFITEQEIYTTLMPIDIWTKLYTIGYVFPPCFVVGENAKLHTSRFPGETYHSNPL